MARLKHLIIPILFAGICVGCGTQQDTRTRTIVPTEHNATPITKGNERNLSSAEPLESNRTKPHRTFRPDTKRPSSLCKGELLHFYDETNDVTTLCKRNDGLQTLRQSDVLLVMLYDTNSTLSKGMLPYLQDLKRRWRDKIDILAVDISHQGHISDEAVFYASDGDIDALLTSWKARTKRRNVVLPWTFLYIRGSFMRHYEGLVPIEMLRHDIDAYLSKE